MNNELIAVLDYLENERGIDRDTLLTLVEESLVAAARKAIGPANELDVTIDRETCDISAWARLEVVEDVDDPESQISIAEAQTRHPDAKLGDMVDWEVTPENFGRIAAQATKQAILYRLRRAEKDRIAEDFQDTIGQLVNGLVSRVERGEVFVDFRRAEGVMRYNDRIPGEDYRPGDHITALLAEVNADRPGPSLIVSRAHPDFVRRLFEREVTEINEGMVEIKAVAREAGYRTKIAVHTDEPRVDPVGACVGLRGNRVKTVVRELAGEKVDIIRWDADIRTYVANALQPAKLSDVSPDEETHTIAVTVPEDQLSLAIGKKGQNARLAAKLTGWKIDINKQQRPEEIAFEDKIHRATENLARIPGIGADTAHLLVSNGFLTLEGVLAAEPEDLTTIDGIDMVRAREILDAARENMGL